MADIVRLKDKIQLLPKAVRDEILSQLDDFQDMDDLELTDQERQLMLATLVLIDQLVELAISMHEAGVPLGTLPCKAGE